MARSKSTENTTEKQEFFRAVRKNDINRLKGFIEEGILRDPAKFDNYDKMRSLQIAVKKSGLDVMKLLVSHPDLMVGVNVGDALSIVRKHQDKNIEDLLIGGMTFNYGFKQYIKEHIIPQLDCRDIDQFANKVFSLLLTEKNSLKEKCAKEDADSLSLQSLLLRAMAEAAKLTDSIGSIFSLEIQQTNILQLAYNLNDHQLILDLLKYKEGRAITVDYNGEKKTPLQKAVLEEDHEMVGYILENMTPEERKQALCIQDREGNTLLHLALNHCCELDEGEVPNTLKELLEYEDDIQEALTTQNKDGETPLYLALYHQLPCFLKLIDEKKEVLFLETKLEKSIIGLMCIYDKQSRCPFNEVVKLLNKDETMQILLKELNNGNHNNALILLIAADNKNMIDKELKNQLINYCTDKLKEASTHGPEDSPSPVATVAPTALVAKSKPCVTVGTTLHAKAAELSTMGPINRQ
jgi:ankyrin repeat protein